MKIIQHLSCLVIISIALFTSCQQKTALTDGKPSTASTSGSLNYTVGQRQPNRLFPDKLRDIPNEIMAAHYPNPCYATYEDSMYIWKHNTTIQTKEDLQIVEFGSFVYTDKGWYLRVTLTAADFEQSYNCKGGLLKKGVVYTDNNSWRRGNTLTGGDAMWYYIAKDKNGRLVKGTAPIETENKLINRTSRNIPVTQSSISWTGYGEVGGYSLTGTMNIRNGDVQLDGNKVSAATINFDIRSIDHENNQLVSHLKDADFFDAKNYPTATFFTEEVVYTDTAKAIANGKITIKGITKEIKIPFTVNDSEKGIVIKGKINIDRTAFGIKYNSSNFFSNLGDQAIKNNFDLAFELNVAR